MNTGFFGKMLWLLPVLLCVMVGCGEGPVPDSTETAALEAGTRKPEETDHKHIYESVVIAPTCTGEGYTAYTCACGRSYEADYADALGHDYENGTCVRCGEQEAPARLDLRYDDHLDLTGRTVEIVNAGAPTSCKVGTAAADESVIALVGGTLIATGTGTAEAVIDGVPHIITVTPAPITLLMITGHSMGAGECGSADLSVIGPAGQVYSSHGTDNLRSATDGVGIGYGSENKARNINAFTEPGTGTMGEGSALAAEYSRLTGEKVWVLNTAVGGSNLTEWLPGTMHYQKAVTQFRRAQDILANEIRAGHYTLAHMGILYHNGANFSYKGIRFTQDELEGWYSAMWSGFKAELCRDVDGDGTEETVSFLGLVPIWTRGEGDCYAYDEPAGLFMGASEAYPDIFVSSVIGREWLTDAGVAENFPDITYRTQNGTDLPRPTTAEDVYSPDAVHYDQVAYNAVGMDIARNLTEFLEETGESPQVTILLADGRTPAGEEVILHFDEPLLLTPVVTPVTENGLTFAVSGCISLSYPLRIAATGNGTGMLTVSFDGVVLKTVTFVCTDADESLAVSDNK